MEKELGVAGRIRSPGRHPGKTAGMACRWPVKFLPSPGSPSGNPANRAPVLGLRSLSRSGYTAYDDPPPFLPIVPGKPGLQNKAGRVGFSGQPGSRHCPAGLHLHRPVGFFSVTAACHEHGRTLRVLARIPAICHIFKPAGKRVP